MDRRVYQVVVWTLLGWILVLAGCAGFAAPNEATDIAAISRIWKTYEKGCNTEDAELWISNWDENGIQLPPDAPAAFGKENILAGPKSRFPKLDIEIAIKSEEIVVMGDWAYSRGTFTRSITPKGSDQTFYYDGKFLTIMRRQPDGSWKIYRDCFNSNTPPQ